jgi:hypothetical protein
LQVDFPLGHRLDSVASWGILKGHFMVKDKYPPLPSVRVFISRIIRNLVIGLAIITLSLGIGMIGYGYFEKMGWIDSFVNASMILSGMGPVSTLQTNEGKIFAGFYALFSGIIFLIVIAIIIAPIFHRFLHRFLVKDTN